ncbi:unnamed protein product [Tenebrio molitor]|nr:unnamed protein product [Tenebrio molitor]
MSIQKKLIVVGDDGCGKNCLLLAFSKDTFNSEYRPMVFENYVVDLEVDGKTTELSLWFPEVQHFCPNILFFGTKNDLRDDQKELENLKKNEEETGDDGRS